MEMPLWLTFRPAYLTVSSPFSTPQLSRSLVFSARITSLMLLPVFTDYEHPSASSIKWQSSSTKPSMAQHLSIRLISSAMSMICWREINFGRLLPAFSASTLHVLSLSVTSHSVLHDHGSGAVYPMTFSPPRPLNISAKIEITFIWAVASGCNCVSLVLSP